jgi:hypothetical protein
MIWLMVCARPGIAGAHGSCRVVLSVVLVSLDYSRPSGKILLDDDSALPVARKRAKPALAANDAGCGAAHHFRVVLKPVDEVEPSLAVMTATGNDGAKLAPLVLDDLGDRRRLDFVAIPGQPKESAARYDIRIDRADITHPPRFMAWTIR